MERSPSHFDADQLADDLVRLGYLRAKAEVALELRSIPDVQGRAEFLAGFLGTRPDDELVRRASASTDVPDDVLDQIMACWARRSRFESRFHKAMFWLAIVLPVAAFVVLNMYMWWLWALLLCIPVGLAALFLPAMLIGTIRNLRPS